jgi:hypothetical protein
MTHDTRRRLQARFGQVCVDVTIVPTGRPFVYTFDVSILTAGDPTHRRAAMLHEEDPTTRLGHPHHFAEGSGVVGECARGERRDHGVECCLRERQFLGVTHQEPYVRPQLTSAPARLFDHLRRDVESRERGDFLQVLEVLAGPAAHVEDVTACTREMFASETIDEEQGVADPEQPPIAGHVVIPPANLLGAQRVGHC